MKELVQAVQSIEGRVFNDHGDIMSTVVLDEDESGQIYPCGNSFSFIPAKCIVHFLLCVNAICIKLCIY